MMATIDTAPCSSLTNVEQPRREIAYLRGEVSMMYLKNSNGEKSLSATMVIVTFIVCMGWMIVGVFEEPFGVKVRPFSETAALAMLGTTCALYFGRKKTDLEASGKTGEIETETE